MCGWADPSVHTCNHIKITQQYLRGSLHTRSPQVIPQSLPSFSVVVAINKSAVEPLLSIPSLHITVHKLSARFQNLHLNRIYPNQPNSGISVDIVEIAQASFNLKHMLTIILAFCSFILVSENPITSSLLLNILLTSLCFSGGYMQLIFHPYIFI